MTAAQSSGLADPRALKFTRRRESWVARSAGHFYKIIRAGDDPLGDLVDPACIATALREFNDMRFLHGIDATACCPEHVDRACIVYPLLSGPDMREVLIDGRARQQRASCLREAMALLARLHHGRSDGFPVKDYRRDGFLQPDGELIDRMQDRKKTLVITGFEARNFRFDDRSNAWLFFDPHHVWQGLPEEDFARFVVSLLMIRGKRGGPRVWTDFDRSGLLSVYERLAPLMLDRTLLNFFLREQLAKRRFHAMNAARRVMAPARMAGMAYTSLYYRQIRRVLPSQQF